MLNVVATAPTLRSDPYSERAVFMAALSLCRATAGDSARRHRSVNLCFVKTNTQHRKFWLGRELDSRTRVQYA